MIRHALSCAALGAFALLSLGTQKDGDSDKKGGSASTASASPADPPRAASVPLALPAPAHVSSVTIPASASAGPLAPSVKADFDSFDSVSKGGFAAIGKTAIFAVQRGPLQGNTIDATACGATVEFKRVRISFNKEQRERVERIPTRDGGSSCATVHVKVGGAFGAGGYYTTTLLAVLD